MSVVWKYPVPLDGFPVNTSPGPVLAVANQDEELVMWVQVDDPTAEAIAREFVVVGTGREFDGHSPFLAYIGTALFADDHLVLHVYEVA